MLLFLWTSLLQNILSTNNCLKCIYRFSLNIRKWLISTFTLEKYCQNIEKKEMRLFVWILNGKDTLCLWDEISFNKCALVLTVHVLIPYPHILSSLSTLLWVCSWWVPLYVIHKHFLFRTKESLLNTRETNTIQSSVSLLSF